MEQFLSQLVTFGKEMLSLSLTAILLENAVFFRAVGVSSGLTQVRGWKAAVLGLLLTLMTTLSALVCFFLQPLLQGISWSDYLLPLCYLFISGALYLLMQLLSQLLLKKEPALLTGEMHQAFFHGIVLSTLLMLFSMNGQSLTGFLGFGIGTGLGFTLGVWILSAARERLNSTAIPAAFRGFPITLIYIGILSLALYGLIGHELTF